MKWVENKVIHRETLNKRNDTVVDERNWNIHTHSNLRRAVCDGTSRDVFDSFAALRGNMCSAHALACATSPIYSWAITRYLPKHPTFTERCQDHTCLALLHSHLGNVGEHYLNSMRLDTGKENDLIYPNSLHLTSQTIQRGIFPLRK